MSTVCRRHQLASQLNSDSGYSDVNPNTNPVCGQQITAYCGWSSYFTSFVVLTHRFSDQGKSTTVTVTDRCQGCAITDLDFSPTAFSDLANESLGRIDITWMWS